MWVDMGYGGQPTHQLAAYAGYDLEIVKRPRKEFGLLNILLILTLTSRKRG